MALTSYDAIVAALNTGNGQWFPWNKASVTSAAGVWTSHWQTAGLPAAGATPATGAGAVPTAATNGAFAVTNPSGANRLNALTFGAGGVTQGVVMLYDRLVHTSGLDGTNTGAQTINSAALTRYTSGVGVLCAIEVYTALGATPRTATISYTNQAGAAGKTSGTISIPANSAAQTIIFPFPFASGDTGIQSVQSLTLSGSTGTAGNFGITLYVPLALIGYNANTYNERDLVNQTANLPQINSNACLAIATLATTSSTGAQFGELVLAQG